MTIQINEGAVFSVFSQLESGYNYCAFTDTFIYGSISIRGAAQFWAKGEPYSISYTNSPVDISNRRGEVIYQIKEGKLISIAGMIRLGDTVWSPYYKFDGRQLPFCLNEEEAPDCIVASEESVDCGLYLEYMMQEAQVSVSNVWTT